MLNDLKTWKVSDDTKRLNPHVFGVGSVSGAKSESGKRVGAKGANARQEKGKRGGRSQLYRVTIISMRRRLIEDRDNLIGGCKAVRDAIAKRLGCDDSDKVIQWEYSQAQTKGEEGVILRVEVL